jgi:tetratricopeptide (TPR) repeat protein
MTSRQRVTTAATLVLVGCLGGAASFVHRLDRVRSDATLQETLYIPSPTVLKRMSLGYTGLLADIYWTRAVQYFGGHHHEGAMEYKLLAPLLDVTTTLDPNLVVAYEFGAVFLAQKPPEGAGDPDAAVRLVERGIKGNPDAWRLYYQLGFIHYIERHDYKAAADAFERGSRVAGAHPWMKIMAATMAEHGGDPNTAKLLWTKIYESSDDQMIKANALKRLRAIKANEDIAYLDRLVGTYQQRTGHSPQTWNEMIAAGYLRGIPVDPLGAPYRLEGGGRVNVQHPEDFPFLKEGTPSGAQPSR